MTHRKREIRIEGSVAYVPLTQGYEAVIDAADVALVSGFNWHAVVLPKHTYAGVKVVEGGKTKRIYLHRFLLENPAEPHIDHIDGNGLNNRRSNLRPATVSENHCNRKRAVTNTSGFKGVSPHKSSGKWRAEISRDGRKRSLGYFSDPESAAVAYAKASADVHGEFGRTE